MKRLIALALVVIVGCLVAAIPAQAQKSCTEIRGIIQAILPSPSRLTIPDDVWGGAVYASLGGNPLIGFMSGNDGAPTQHGARGGRYQVNLCGTELPTPICGSFAYEVPNSVFGFAPGKVGLGEYHGNTAKIISGTGTGRFLGASGNLNIAGPFIVWPDSNDFGVSGRWNGEFSGRICGIQ